MLCRRHVSHAGTRSITLAGQSLVFIAFVSASYLIDFHENLMELEDIQNSRVDHAGLK